MEIEYTLRKVIGKRYRFLMNLYLFYIYKISFLLKLWMGIFNYVLEYKCINMIAKWIFLLLERNHSIYF